MADTSTELVYPAHLYSRSQPVSSRILQLRQRYPQLGQDRQHPFQHYGSNLSILNEDSRLSSRNSSSGSSGSDIHDIKTINCSPRDSGDSRKDRGMESTQRAESVLSVENALLSFYPQ